MITEWRRSGLPVDGGTVVVVAVSGGADSVSLLLGIDDLRKRKKLDLRVVAAHFDHRLRTGSGADLELVRGLAAERGFELAHGEMRPAPAGNVEQEARKARYEFLAETAERLKAGWVLTAHTMNDQAETVLMNLVRGSGPDGLGGIRRMRPLRPGIVLARPLLSWAKRRDTEGFCLENNVEFTRDPMNEDLNYRRVWVRKVLIPMLAEVNPKIVDTLCDTARLLGDRSGDEPDTPSVIGLPEPGTTLDLKHLKTLSEADFNLVIRDWVRANRGNLRGIGAKHVRAVYELAHSGKSGRTAELPGGRVDKTGGRLAWRENKAKKG